MPAIIIVLLIGLIGGIAVGVQGPMASLISQRVGTLESIFIVHFGGAIAVLLPLLWRGGNQFKQINNTPWYTLGAGALGLIVIGSLSYTIPRIGIALSTIVLVMGQLIIGTIADHFGLFGVEIQPISATRMLGLVVIGAGIWLMLRR